MWFLSCVALGYFEKFLDDPYYEPLLWFMIVKSVPHHCVGLCQVVAKLVTLFVIGTRAYGLQSIYINTYPIQKQDFANFPNHHSLKMTDP